MRNWIASANDFSHNNRRRSNTPLIVEIGYVRPAWRNSVNDACSAEVLANKKNFSSSSTSTLLRPSPCVSWTVISSHRLIECCGSAIVMTFLRFQSKPIQSDGQVKTLLPSLGAEILLWCSTFWKFIRTHFDDDVSHSCTILFLLFLLHCTELPFSSANHLRTIILFRISFAIWTALNYPHEFLVQGLFLVRYVCFNIRFVIMILYHVKFDKKHLV